MNAMMTTEKRSSYLVPEERAILMIEACANEIFKATTLKDVLKTVSQAEAIAAAVRALEASERVQRDADFLKIRAERRLGELSMRLPKGRPVGTPISPTKFDMAKEGLAAGHGVSKVAADTGLHRATVRKIQAGKRERPDPIPVSKDALLIEAGISPNRARTAERIAQLPESSFEKVVREVERPTLTCVAKHIGALNNYPSPSRKVGALLNESISLLDTCCKARRPPRRDEVNALELKLAALNVTK